MLGTTEEIIKVIEKEYKKDMDLEEREVMEMSYYMFIRYFSDTLFSMF